MNERLKKVKKLYDNLIIILALLSVVLAIIDLSRGMSTTLRIIDTVIYVVFVLDYIMRFIIDKHKLEFVKNNIIDLIAIIPASSLFKALKLLKFGKLIRISKFSKLLVMSSRSVRGFKQVKSFLNTNGFKYVLSLSSFAIIVSSSAMMFIEHMSFPDALWWSLVTVTTVGYGDITPCTIAGKAISILLMLVGIGLIGSLTSSITSFFLKSRTSDNIINNDKIDMCLTLYEKLNEAEKVAFRRIILKEDL